MVVHRVINENDLDVQIEAAGDKLAILDFDAAWCAPCRSISPYFEELSEEFKDVVFINIDIDQIPPLEAKYDIRSIPTFILLKKKNKVAQMSGTDKEKLKSLIVQNQ